jgi:hypothetical protein
LDKLISSTDLKKAVDRERQVQKALWDRIKDAEAQIAQIKAEDERNFIWAAVLVSNAASFHQAPRELQ